MANARRWSVWVLLLLLIAVFSAMWLVAKRNESRRDIVVVGSVPALTMTSSSFADGSLIPAKFTCDGGDTSPQLSFSAPAAGTTSLSLIAHDPDAPAEVSVQWVA